MSCIFKGNCCTAADEKFWVEDPKSLFCTLNPYPKGSINSPRRLNAVTRLILYLSVLFFFLKYKYWYVFLALGLIFIILLYYITNNNKKMNEHFDFIPDNSTPINSKSYLQTPLSLYTDTRSDMSSNVTNNSMDGSTNDLIKKQSGYPLKNVQRDIEAGIQYYTPNKGTNPRVYVPPVIGSRIFDQEVWGQSKNVRPRTNFLKTRDITELELQIPDLAGNSTSIGVPIVYTSQVPNSAMPQNKLNAPTYDGYYPSEQNDTLQGMDERDFAATVLPTYHNPVQLEAPFELANKIPIPGFDNYNQYDFNDSNPLEDINETMFNTQINPTEKKPDEMTSSDVTKEYNTILNKENKKEKFSYPPNYQMNQNSQQNNNQTNNRNMQNWKLSQRPTLNPINESQYNYALEDKFFNKGNIMDNKQYYDTMNRVPPGQDWQPHTVMSQMVPQSPTYVYNDSYFDQPDRRLFLQDIQPKLYSYTIDQQPINSNVGISYAPQMPPPVLDQITDSQLSRPIMTRIDPQLVRTDGTRAQQALSPQRTNWSAEYSNFVPPPGSINFEDIYDPRFTSYGDPYRSYSDINLGQVQYYYSDVDAYRMPNFATRSNVDFIEYRTPQGQIWPEYQRTSGVDDVRPYVEDQYTADDTFHREDLMSLQMNKANRIAWSQRFAPLRQRGANTHATTFGPGI